MTRTTGRGQECEGQEEVRQECDRVRRKWDKFLRGSARRGEGVSGVQQEVGNECDRESRKWCRTVRVQQEWDRSVRGSAGSAVGV